MHASLLVGVLFPGNKHQVQEFEPNLKIGELDISIMTANRINVLN